MTNETTGTNPGYIALVGDIVAAYVSNNHVAVADLPALIANVHAAMAGLPADGTPAQAAPPTVAKASPAQIRKSITPDALISFIDGKGYKTLKRHLTKHGLEPDGYRARYGLPADYPMVAASYSQTRSSLARSLGLGQLGGQRAENENATPAAKGRGKAA